VAALPLTLHLLRHAKSSWDVPGQEDHDRALNGRGRKAAKAMGRYLARQGPLPDRVLCSTSVRTRETWDRMRPSLEAAGAHPAVEFERDLYLAGAGALLERVRACDGDSCLLVVAHNPGTGDLALGLAGGGDEEAWRRMRDKYPTAALASLVFEAASWSEIAPNAGELVRFVVPRELGDVR
jgi:phosphohistidine phosphatase